MHAMNQTYRNDLIVMGVTTAFVRGEPENGGLAKQSVILAGDVGVATDAVGAGALRFLGTTSEVSQRRIFQQKQAAKSVELGIVTQSAKEIRLISSDAESEKDQKTEKTLQRNEEVH